MFMKTSYKSSAVAVLMFIVAFSSFGIGADTGLAGDTAIEGVKKTLVGDLAIENGVLSISTPKGTNTIRTGNRHYSASIGMDLQEGIEIAVFGFLIDSDVIPIVIVAEGEAFFLRDTDGAPLWMKGRFFSVE